LRTVCRKVDEKKVFFSDEEGKSHAFLQDYSRRRTIEFVGPGRIQHLTWRMKGGKGGEGD